MTETLAAFLISVNLDTDCFSDLYRLRDSYSGCFSDLCGLGHWLHFWPLWTQTLAAFLTSVDWHWLLFWPLWTDTGCFSDLCGLTLAASLTSTDSDTGCFSDLCGLILAAFLTSVDWHWLFLWPLQIQTLAAFLTSGYLDCCHDFRTWWCLLL